MVKEEIEQAKNRRDKVESLSNIVKVNLNEVKEYTVNAFVVTPPLS